MAIDYWQLVKDFSTGDMVQRIAVGQGITPYTGRVQAVMRGIGFLDVQWPFGSERISPEELVKVNPQLSPYLPPTLNFSYFPGQDATKQAATSPWRTTEVPADFHRVLARLYHQKVGEVLAYDELWHRFGAATEDEVIRDEVGKFYRFAHNSLTMFLGEFARKTATYWAAKDRTHRATKAEVDAGRPNCPKCGTPMRRTTYKMQGGQKIRLFACPSDLYLIKENQILGPGGGQVWGQPVPVEEALVMAGLKDFSKEPGFQGLKGLSPKEQQEVIQKALLNMDAAKDGPGKKDQPKQRDVSNQPGFKALKGLSPAAQRKLIEKALKRQANTDPNLDARRHS